ncbi:MAG TPA: alpha/beta fold hydrolase [Myxococcales bacterium]|nr:alpha/beta fold hydrolase [Myxococcales bacterium]
MVLAGQYLERSVVVGELDALFHRGTRDPPCAIAAPHPALGGSMLSPVIAELAWALTRAGHPTLRFDYRGVGASRGVSGQRAGSGRIDDLRSEVADLRQICDHLLATTGMSAACAVGYSFGAAVALEAAEDPRIARLVLIAPPTGLYDFAATAKLTKPLLVVCAQHDRYCDRGALKLPEGATLEVIAHADHFFARGLTELGKTVASWLRGERPELVAPEDAASTGTRLVELDPGAGAPLELDVDPE